MTANETGMTSIHKREKPTNGYRGPLRQIRILCVDCAAGPKAVRYCTGVDCPVWPYRFGKNPKRVIREEGKSSASLFDKDWILREAKRSS
jgi:hypothetical protein